MHQDFETKYIHKNSHALKLKKLLESKFEPDPEYPEAIISSIYYDTYTLSHLDEKINSDHIKSKFRIRWYEDIDSKTISPVSFLEFKHKIGEKRFKRRIKTKNIHSELPLESLKLNALFNELRLYNDTLLDHLYPSFIVSYTRKRFILPKHNFRLCLDYNINVPKTNFRLLGRKAKPHFLEECVFEIKGPSARLPSELYFLEEHGTKKNAFSKYERCYVELIDQMY